MPKIEITDSKGLVQVTGSGCDIQSKGLRAVIVSAETSIPVAVGNTDIEFAMPAGALVTDFGFVVTSAVGGTDGDGDAGIMTVDLGTTAGGAQLVAAAAVANGDATILAGRSMSVLNKVEAVATGAPFADFVDAAALHSATARTLTARFAQSVGEAAAIGKVHAYVEYTIIN
jgi:hypothetical protein